MTALCPLHGAPGSQASLGQGNSLELDKGRARSRAHLQGQITLQKAKFRIARLGVP